MPDPQDLPLQSAVKYNPHLWNDEELRAVFVARGRELSDILERIRGCAPGRVPQHLLIAGYRGMGKTTLLRRIALAVADDPRLAERWIALTFPEEQYTVSTLAELWINVLDALADTLERQGAAAAELARLDTRVRDILALAPGEREAAALALLQGWAERARRRILLLIDSSDLLFAALGRTEGKRGRAADAGATPLWRLRKTLSHDPCIFWLGASYQALEADHQYSDAFHDFFEILELRPLSLDEMRQAMLALARAFGAGKDLRGEAAEREMRRNLDARPERLKSLRALTGGNPRTTVVLYELFAAGWQGDVHSDLKALLDLMTPLYKARMEQLAEQPRKLLAHLMEHWAPIGAGDLARASGIPATTVSGQLARLEAEGLVEKTPLAGTSRSGYQASERFFNVWYLMRYTPRRVRQRLAWLVEFMRLWFSADDLRQEARRSLGELRAGRRQGQQLEYALALSDVLPDGCDERHLLEWSVFSTARREAERSRKALAEILPELFDPRQPEQPLVTADNYLKRFQTLDAKLALCPYAEGEELQEWIHAVKGSLHLSLVNKEWVADVARGLNEEQYKQAQQLLASEIRRISGICSESDCRRVRAAIFNGVFFPDCPDPKLAYQQIVTEFSEVPGALRLGLKLMARRHRDTWTEKLYLKAIELKPKSAFPWFGLGNLLSDHLDRHEEAEAAFCNAIELDPNTAFYWFALGNLLNNHVGGYKRAEAAYRKAIELDPKSSFPWFGLGNLLKDQLGRYEEAEAAYRRAIELDPSDSVSWSDLGNLLKDYVGRQQEAEVAYRKAIELAPNDAVPWNSLGNLLQDDLGRPTEAEAAYRRAAELAPEELPPLVNLGRLLAMQGDLGEAERAYRQADELVAKRTHIKENIGYVDMVLQSQLWLRNLDVARQALEQLASAVSAGDNRALARLQKQARECYAIGLSLPLVKLMEASPHADLLRPIALGLRAADQGPRALDGVAAEIRAMAEESLADIQR